MYNPIFLDETLLFFHYEIVQELLKNTNSIKPINLYYRRGRNTLQEWEGLH